MFKKSYAIILLVLLAMTTSVFAAVKSTPDDINNKRFAIIKANIKSIDVTTLKKQIDNDRDFILLDVRESGEIKAAKIETKGNLAIPRGIVEFAFHRRVQKKETIVVVYCLKGNRSAIVTDLLTKYGYSNTYNLNEGILEWIKAGYPVANFFGTFEIKNLKSIY